MDGDTLNVTLTAGESYTLPVATAARLGGIKVGNGMSIDSAGKLDVTLTGGNGNPFSETVTMKGGIYIADSLNNDLGDYGTLKATYDTINVNNSTITGNHSITGEAIFKGRAEFDFTTVLKGFTTFESKPTFETGLKIENEQSTNLGTRSTVQALEAQLLLRNSSVVADHVSVGSVYGFPYHFLDKAVFDGKPTLYAGFEVADSMTCDFGEHDSIKASNDTINVTNSTILGAHTVSGNVTFTGNVSGISLSGGNPFSEKVTMNGGFQVADSMNNDLGSYGTISATYDSINVSNSTIRANNASLRGDNADIILSRSDVMIDNRTESGHHFYCWNTNIQLGDSTLNVNENTITATAASIGGTPIFTENLILSTVPVTQDGGIWYVV